MTRAVLFDVGGPIDTEVEYERLVDLHISEALAQEGVRVDIETLASASEWAVERFAPNTYQSMIWHLLPNPERARHVFEVVAHRADERQSARGGLELRPGIVEVLDFLRGRGLLLGLAANQPADIVTRLDRFGVGKAYFGHLETSGVHGFRKPDVRLFLRACEDLGVDPHECVMVGDRIDNDIVPASWLGMRTILLRTGRHRKQQPRSAAEVPTFEATSVEELADCLELAIAH